MYKFTLKLIFDKKSDNKINNNNNNNNNYYYYYYYYYKVNAGWGRDKKTKKKKTKKHKNVACCIRTFLSKVCGPIFPGLLLLLLFQSERWLGEEARKQRRKKQKV